MKPVVMCADRLGKAWDKGTKGTAIIAIPVDLLAGLLGRYEWVVFLMLTIFVGFRIVRASRTAFRDKCPVCGTDGGLACAGRNVMFTCPTCQQEFETDCEIHYSGARPAKAGRFLPRYPAP